MELDPDSGVSRTTGRPRRPVRAAVFATVGAGLAAGAMLVSGLATSANAAGTSLATLAEAQGRYFGTALTQNNLSNSALTTVANANFDMVTPGNEMKWDTTEPSNGTYNFGPGDAIVSYAKAHNMRVRGHNLVWHSQLPSWVSSLPTSQVQAAMEAHITTEVTHYKGQVYSWDVVNEPFDDSGNLRQDAFYNAMGSGYIADALKTAHAADPNAKLYLNDYNIEGENTKSDAMYNLAKSLLAAGAPLNGIGFESHFIVGQVPSTMTANMQRFAALGLDVAVTELDDRMNTPASSSDLNQQATDYSTVIKDCLAVSRCVGVSQWGVGDADSWIPSTFSGQGAATMFDNNYQPKASYNAAVAALGGSGSTTGGTTGSTTSGTTGSTTSGTTGSTTSGTTGSTTSGTTGSTTSGTTGGTTGGTGGSGCKITDSVSSWNTGMTENLTITNTGSSAISGWKVGFTLPSGQVITSGWNATYSPASGAVTATNMSYNGSLPVGASTTIGFQGTHTGDSAAAPSSFTLNGVTCSS
jgi:endo-1,4-beta-xylanase